MKKIFNLLLLTLLLSGTTFASFPVTSTQTVDDSKTIVLEKEAALESIETLTNETFEQNSRKSDESGGDMEETAKFFLSNNAMWKSWVPADVAAKVADTL